MVHISQFIMKTLLTLKKCKPGDQVIIKTYKKDRSITVRKEDTGYHVTEDGFAECTYEDITQDELPRLLGQLKAKEFPRSNQVWFQVQKKK